MTKTEIAYRAIRGTRLNGSTHIDIMETMRTLKLSTDDALELRRLVVHEWMTTTDRESGVGAVLNLARTVVNQYARDYRLR